MSSGNPMPENTQTLEQVALEGASQSLPEHTASSSHYDVDIASEVLRSVSVLNPTGSESRINAVTRHLNTTIQPDTKGTAPDISAADLPTFLIAMACRPPFGPPSHSLVYTPQNEAFLPLTRNCTSSLFIQTPNLNAE